eukprot:CAMPEP_0198114824 /NCGR_PEP_ID=MMETSP1442-20131203/6090_1 /TAXON_ID= /ORGANISM="Craspedostauros australis, Strain CCMP3328" /LENGTH=245 /DNA_ID=CAMNT_0043772219 /DNA_START=72 /DNA_END=809 /DNA_ORIENTATION=+
MDVEKQPYGGPQPVVVGAPQPVAVGAPQPVAVAVADTTYLAPPVAVTDEYKGAGNMAPPPSDVPMHQQQKIGTNCCGCCCDFRRAVIVVSIISLVFGALGVLGALAENDEAAPGQEEWENEEVKVYNEEVETANLVSGIIGLVMAGVSLFGALQYNAIAVGISVAYSIISFIVGIIVSEQAISEVEDETGSTINATGGYVIGAVILGLFLYPSIGFIMEVRSGVMSQQTYPREEYSCCCTQNRRY